MSTKNSFQFFLLVILSSSLLVCASVPKYLPPEIPKADVCDAVGKRLLTSLKNARNSVKSTLPGKVVYFETRLTGQTCLTSSMGIFNVMFDIVTVVDKKEKKYACASHLFIIEGKIDSKGELISRFLQVYTGTEELCDFEENE